MHFFIIILSWTCVKASISFFLSVSTVEIGPQRSAFRLSGMAGVGVRAQVGVSPGMGGSSRPSGWEMKRETILGGRWEQEGGDC